MKEDSDGLKNFGSVVQLNNVDSTSQPDNKPVNLRDLYSRLRRQRLHKSFINKLKWNCEKMEPQYINMNKNKKILFKIGSINYPQRFLHILIILNLLVNIILSFLASFEGFLLSFRKTQNRSITVPLKSICLFFYSLLFVVNCTNRNYSNGKTHLYITDVVREYFYSGTMILDMLILVYCIFTLAQPKQVHIYSMAFFFILILALIFNVSNIVKIEATYIRSQKRMLIWSLIKFSISNIILAHIIGSIMLAIGQTRPGQSWLTKLEIQQSSWDIQYFWAFYWATTTMMTIGYGDVTPNNQVQAILISFIEMFSCIVLGYHISTIGTIISRLKDKQEQVTRKIAIFDRMIKSEDGSQIITKELQKNIYDYLKQLQGVQNSLDFEMRKSLLNDLPEHLRQQYFYQINKRLFENPAFFHLLTPITIQKITTKFTSKFYYRQEKIVGSEEKILILQRGSVGLVYQKKGSLLKGKYFDEIGAKGIMQSKLLTPWFFSLPKKPKYTFKSKSDSVIWEINYEDFVDALREIPWDFQFYFSNYHKHSFSQDQWNQVQCQRCSNQNNKIFHSVFDCPRLTFTYLNQMVFFKFTNQSTLTNFQRKEFVRKKKTNRITLSQRKKLFESSKNKMLRLRQKYNHLYSEKKEGSEIIVMQRRRKQSIGEFRQSSQLISAANRHNPDDFWKIQIDSGYNYSNYFPNQNPNRLIERCIFENEILKHSLGVSKMFF